MVFVAGAREIGDADLFVRLMTRLLPTLRCSVLIMLARAPAFGRCCPLSMSAACMIAEPPCGGVAADPVACDIACCGPAAFAGPSGCFITTGDGGAWFGVAASVFAEFMPFNSHRTELGWRSMCR